MTKKLLLTVLPICLLSFVFAQSPHLNGTVNVDLQTGQITCDFSLTNIPELGKDYQLLLNKGFNIKHIKNARGEVIAYDGFYNGKMRGEGLAYIPKSGDKVLENPKQLEISYTGAFPIYKDDYNFTDFKGLIAFNGTTLRASEQSKWYPVIYDVKKDQLLEQVTYAITVKCNNAEQIFVNGDEPKAGPTAKFASEVPLAPLLFIGNYKVQQTSNAVFLNTAMTKAQLAVFEAEIAEMKAFYHRKLGIPYQTKNVIIEHTAVEKFNKGRIWGFASYPTIAIAGGDLGGTIDEANKKFKDSTDYPFYAHEVAHYYFGNVLQPNATLFWFFLESTAEYLSVKATEAKFGKVYSNAYFKNACNNLKNFKVVPLNKVTEMNQIGGTYRYNYGPLILRGLEQMIGEKRMFDFLKTCLKAKPKTTDYAFFRDQAMASGITEAEWNAFEKQFIDSENITALIKY